MLNYVVPLTGSRLHLILGFKVHHLLNWFDFEFSIIKTAKLVVLNINKEIYVYVYIYIYIYIYKYIYIYIYIYIYTHIYIYIYIGLTAGLFAIFLFFDGLGMHARPPELRISLCWLYLFPCVHPKPRLSLLELRFQETKKQSPTTGARANNTLHK